MEENIIKLNETKGWSWFSLIGSYISPLFTVLTSAVFI